METRSMTRAGLVLVAVLSMAGCSAATGVEIDSAASIAAALAAKPVEVTLAKGEYKRVVDAGLGVRFKGVSADSRCPIDAVCVWAGDAVAELELTAGAGTTALALHTTLEPRSESWNGAKVTLLELTPAPRAAEPTRADQYVVKLRFEPADR
jgi:hypothetical protein